MSRTMNAKRLARLEAKHNREGGKKKRGAGYTRKMRKGRRSA